MVYQVVLSQEAAQDVERLFELALERELVSVTGDLNVPRKAIQVIKDAVASLRTSPFSCRQAGTSAFVRELIIGFGRTGYFALTEVVDGNTVIIGAVRH